MSFFKTDILQHCGVMKLLINIVLIFVANLSMAQVHSAGFVNNSTRVRPSDVLTPDSLAHSLTATCTTELQKVKAIFRWITDNIEYSMPNPYGSPRFANKTALEDDPDDTGKVLKPLNERVAIGVLKKRSAVCDGYARLFKTLCDYAGIQSEIITGYARTNIGRVGERFGSNHNWNAVLIDSAWHLLDATWASGYISYWGNEYVKSYDDYYFLTPPEDFIRDHYPEDIKWTLLPHPPTLREFNHTPFKLGAFRNFKILTYKPAVGLIEAAVGDTLQFELETEDDKKKLLVTDSLYYDSTLFVHAGKRDSLKNATCTVNGKKVSYTYTVTSPAVEWLYILYNDEVIMRYKLDSKKNLTAEK